MIQKPTTGKVTEPNWQALLPVARELEHWVAALPAVAVEAREGREEFRERLSKGEALLVAKLRRLPGCSVTASPQGLQTTLRLAGVEVVSHSGLIGACRSWIAAVRDGALREAQATRKGR